MQNFSVLETLLQNVQQYFTYTIRYVLCHERYAACQGFHLRQVADKLEENDIIIDSIAVSVFVVILVDFENTPSRNG